MPTTKPAHLLYVAAGVFQGLAVHGIGGQQLSDAALPGDVVAQAFTWAAAADVSCVAFLGDECATLRLTQELRELHTRWATTCAFPQDHKFTCHQRQL